MSGWRFTGYKHREGCVAVHGWTDQDHDGSACPSAQEILFAELKRYGLATRMSGSGFYNPTFGRFSQTEAKRQLAMTKEREH